MSREAIPADSVLNDLVSSLSNPEDRIRSVLATMVPCRREHGNAYVRIGVTGEGKAPYHKVFFRSAGGDEVLFGTFYGERRDDSFQEQRGAWSTRASSFEEVQDLLGRVRGTKVAGAQVAMTA